MDGNQVRGSETAATIRALPRSGGDAFVSALFAKNVTACADSGVLEAVATDGAKGNLL